MSLTTCLKKAGSAISEADKAAIIERARELRGEGMKPTAAASKAVAELLATAEAEVARLSGGGEPEELAAAYPAKQEAAAESEKPAADFPPAPERKPGLAGVEQVARIYIDRGRSYDDFTAGLKGFYQSSHDYMNGAGNLDVPALRADLEAAGHAHPGGLKKFFESLAAGPRAEEQAAQPAGPAPMPAIASIPMSLAQQAHAGTSFTPERRAEQERDSFKATLQDAWERAARVAGNDPAAIARITEVFQDVSDGYRARYVAMLQAKSRVMSAMIAGPARFPTERNRKRIETEMKRAEEASAYLDRGIKRLMRAARGPIDNSPASELERVRLNLSQREELQETMKAANAALRKGDDAALEDLGFTPEQIADMKKGSKWDRGFPAYRLTNNNAEIRRLRERLKEAEARVAAAESGPVESERQGVRIVEDATDDRIRLIFDGKPSEEVRNELKAAAFKWSPKNEAWQRQLTPNAKRAAQDIIDKHFPAEKAQPATEEGEGATNGEAPKFSRSNPQTETPAFKKWFGDSKVVDAEGKPLVVYHGTGEDFSVFKNGVERGDDPLYAQTGLYFAEDSGISNIYGGREGGNVMPVYLNIRNPLDLNDTSTIAGWKGAIAKAIAPRMAAKVMREEALRNSLSQSLIMQSERDKLMAAGYDGIKGAGGVWIAFRAEQIKSAIGNNGDFNPDSADIRTSRSGRTGQGISITDAEAIVADIRATMPTAPQIVVVESVGQLPDKLRMLIEQEDADNDVEGVYWGGKVYAVTSHFSDLDRFRFVVAHHELRHHGFGAMLGPRLHRMMMQIYRSNAKVRELADKNIRDGIAKDVVVATEEALADMPVEDLVKLNFWASLKAAVREFLRNLAIKLEKKNPKLADMLRPEGWTDEDIARLISRAEDMSRTGEPDYVRGGAVFSQQADQTKSEAFRKWFGDSKVVDAEGKPLVVYHGTTGDFNTFQRSKDGKAGAGIYMTGDASYTSVWSRGEGANVMPVYASIKNPIVLQQSDGLPLEVIAEKHSDVFKGRDPFTLSGEEISDAIRAAGFDGVIQQTSADPFFEVMALDPEQIKSAIGNNGDFNPDSADIRFSRARPNVTLHEDLSRIGTQIASQGYTTADVPNLQATRKLASLVKRLEEGKITAEYFTLAVKGLSERMQGVAATKAANKVMAERERGADIVREKLIRARRQGDLDPDGVEFALWALDKNPALADNLGISIRAPKEGGVSGDYNPAAEVIRLFKSPTAHADTAVHEILHHAERMMPPEMQDAIRREWAKALDARLKTATPEQRKALENIAGALAGDKASYQALVKAIKEGPLTYWDYQYVNPSEFWAVNATELLGFRHKAEGKVWAKMILWLNEMEQKVRSLLGLPSEAAILKALKYVTNPENFGVDRAGRFESPEMLSDLKSIKASGAGLMSIRKHDARTTEALARAGIRPSATWREKVGSAFGSALDVLRDRDELLATARQLGLDQFHGIDRAVKRDIGNLPTEQDPYVAARLANGATSAVMRALLLHGQARWTANGQHLEKIPGTKGLLDILAPLGEDVHDWFGWMIGNRAARLMKEGREHNFTPDQIAALQALATPKKKGAFQKAALEYAAFKRSVLDVAQMAGLINPETRKSWDYADYIPFYRQTDAGADGVAAPRMGRKGLSGQSSGIRTLKGGTSSLNDPIENLLMNFSRLIDASLKNNAIRSAVDALSEAGSEAVHKVGYDFAAEVIPADQVRKRLIEAGTPEPVLDAIPPEAFDGMAKMWAIKQPADPDVVRVMVDGKPQFYRVNDALLLRALTSFTPFNFPGLGLMRAAKRLLTAAVTSIPAFWATNFTRDTVATQAIARDGFVIPSFRNPEVAEAMLFAGASFGSGQLNAGGDPASVASEMRRALRRKGMNASTVDGFMATVLDTSARVWEVYHEIGAAVENANRFAVYDAANAAGRGLTAAAYEGKDLMDFSLRGSWPAFQLLADVVPFINARAQGMYRLGRADPKRLATVGAIITVASLLLAMANDGEDWYEELPDWDKDTYWHFKIGGHHFRIPKPFEVGVAFATIPERIGRSIKGLDSGKKTMSRVWWNVHEQLKADVLPWEWQLFKPVTEVVFNHDSFREGPIENNSDEGKLPAYRYNAKTSDTMRVAATKAAPLVNAIELGPKKMEHLVNGYFGTAGSYALGLSDMVVRRLEGKPPGPSLRADDVPLVKSFYRMDPARATIYESELYKVRQEVNEIFRSVNALKKDQPAEAVKLAAKEQDKLALRKVITHAADQLAGLRRQADAIYLDPVMSPEEKRRQLDAIQVQKNAVSRGVMTLPAVKETF